MNLTPDQLIFWQYGFLNLNLTIVMTWLIGAILTLSSWLITRHVSRQLQVAPWQNLAETIILFVRKQICEVGLPTPDRYLSLLVTLFLFIALSALLTIIPGYEAPTGSLSTTTGLAILIFIAVPAYGIHERGLGSYLKHYVEPTPVMLPFNILTELSRTLALAVRLFGNMLSDTMILAIVLIIAPLFFPIIVQLLGLLTGFVQAYIFTILAMVYIAAAVSGKEG